MKTKKVIEAAHRLSKSYRVRNGKKFRLKDVDPGDTGEHKSEDKPRAKEALQTGLGALTELQDMLYGQDRWSLLLIFQAMDAAGKDGTIKHVMSGVNPQGCQVSSDNKWFTRVIVASAVIDVLASLNLCYPKVSAAKAKELAEARKALLASK